MVRGVLGEKRGGERGKVDHTGKRQTRKTMEARGMFFYGERESRKENFDDFVKEVPRRGNGGGKMKKKRWVFSWNGTKDGKYPCWKPPKG